MSNLSIKNVFIESAAKQEEHLRGKRKTLKVLQSVATDKENLTGRPQPNKLNRIKEAIDVTLASTEQAKRKKITTSVAETQTSPEKSRPNDGVKIIEIDLTSDSPSENYWERLAEKRRLALELCLEENQQLHDRVNSLEEELNVTRQMLEETKAIVETLTEIVDGAETVIFESSSEQEVSTDDTSDDQEPSSTIHSA